MILYMGNGKQTVEWNGFMIPIPIRTIIITIKFLPIIMWSIHWTQSLLNWRWCPCPRLTLPLPPSVGSIPGDRAAYQCPALSGTCLHSASGSRRLDRSSRRWWQLFDRFDSSASGTPISGILVETFFSPRTRDGRPCYSPFSHRAAKSRRLDR